MAMFRIGQKVVCVNDDVIQYMTGYVSSWVKIGKIYTIREILPPDFILTDEFCLCLEEIISDQHPMGGEYGWRFSRFRPLTERKTDISIFTKMLNPDHADA